MAGRFLKEYNRNNRLAQALLTLIGFCRIYYVFKIKVCLPFNILFLKVQFAPKKVFLSPIFFETLLQSCKLNRALHLCWQKIKPVPYPVSSVRFISAQRWTGIGRKSTVPRKYSSCLPLLHNEKSTLSGSRIIHTLMWENMQVRWSVIVLTSSRRWEKVNSLGARIECFWHATKKSVDFSCG